MQWYIRQCSCRQRKKPSARGPKDGIALGYARDEIRTRTGDLRYSADYEITAT